MLIFTNLVNIINDLHGFKFGVWRTSFFFVKQVLTNNIALYVPNMIVFIFQFNSYLLVMKLVLEIENRIGTQNSDYSKIFPDWQIWRLNSSMWRFVLLIKNIELVEKTSKWAVDVGTLLKRKLVTTRSEISRDHIHDHTIKIAKDAKLSKD